MTLFRPVLSPGLRAGSHAGSYAGLLAALLACAAALAPPAAAQTLPDLPDAAVAHDGIVLLTPDNTRQVGPPARRLAHVVFPARSVPVLGGDPPDPAYAMLRRMVAAGQAAGNSGDLYENRDHSHSSLSHEAFPQLTHVRYDARLRAQGFDYGLPLEMLFDAPVIGNASLAQTGGPLWRSPTNRNTAISARSRWWRRPLTQADTCAQSARCVGCSRRKSRRPTAAARSRRSRRASPAPTPPMARCRS